jgi:hypothetical protein
LSEDQFVIILLFFINLFSDLTIPYKCRGKLKLRLS